MKLNENKMKKKQKLPFFCFAAKLSEREAKFVSLQCEKSVFRLFSHLKRNKNTMMQK
jgi:hypothetical protein